MNKENKKILYIDMDNVLVNFQSGIERLEPFIRSKYAEELDNVPGIFSLMNPMPGAVDAFHRLCVKFDTYILSTAPWNNPTAWSDKVQWVKKYLGNDAYKRLILSHHKDLNRGDYLIDDKRKNGAGEFEGELIEFGSEKFPDWNVVVEYLMSK